MATSSVLSSQGASFDPTRQYRYHLWRQWGGADCRRLTFIMLNPSTADAEVDDPTIRACLRFARDWGYGRLDIVNLFAYRTPDPRQLRLVGDPVGAENDAYLQRLAQSADQVICAWGNWGSLHDRDRQVLRLLHQRQPNLPLYCLMVNRTGQPRHPLYVPRQITPQPWPT